MNSEEIVKLYTQRLIELDNLSELNELKSSYYQEMICWLDKFVTYFSKVDKKSSYTHITYNRIYSIVNPIENNQLKIFINNLLILNILNDHFQACNLISEEVIAIDKEWLDYCILNQLYIDPFSDESISKENFSRMISRYFSFTEEFKEYLEYDFS